MTSPAIGKVCRVRAHALRRGDVLILPDLIMPVTAVDTVATSVGTALRIRCGAEGIFRGPDEKVAVVRAPKEEQ